MPKRKTEGTRIELKKLTIYERMSEETTAFVAEIFIDGINAGHAKNDGHGGSTYYYAYPEHRNLMNEAEKHCLALPPKRYEASHGMRAFEVKMDLENFIDGLVEDELKRKDNKKFEKKMTNHIMWGTPNGNTYFQTKLRQPIHMIDRVKLQEFIDRIKKNFTEGQQFLNTNLQALGIQI